ncbi:MAG: cell division protein FtsZ [Bacteroidetes bacterium GWE2_29_8]|nr:MAG: cell division protein FtsZ [Bacteroidetes bacterium GWE2_29_8]OFY15622.1 MAG: cell division protein FtsZ [Bacteroidetes bacterium GWF2_29_10]
MEKKNFKPIIKVIGVGGGGTNAVNFMYSNGINDVDFIVCNTDYQSLASSKVPVKIQLGSKLTQGLGAGQDPKKGADAATESMDEIKNNLQNTKMLFIAAGMGGGTGTGAAPIIAKLAKEELKILTVAIVTVPFFLEGPKRKKQAEEGIKELKQYVDALIVIRNDKIREFYGNQTVRAAFANADNVLNIAAKSISNIINYEGYINVDFNDVETVMKDSGVAIMGSAFAEGEGRAEIVTKSALNSPLLNDNQIYGAKNVLLYISHGNEEITMDEMECITKIVQEEAGENANVILGLGHDQALENKISATIVATGFATIPEVGVKIEATKVINHTINVEEKEVKVVDIETKPEVKQTTEAIQTDNIFNINIKQNKPFEDSYNINSDSDVIDSIKPIEATQEKEIIPTVLSNDDDDNSYSESIEKKGIDTKKNDDRKNTFKQLSEASKNNYFDPNSNPFFEEDIDYRNLDLSKYESEPAFVRHNKNIDDTIKSSDNIVSKYSVGGALSNYSLKSDNSYLNDKAD